MKRIFSPILSLLVMLTAFSCNDYVADMDMLCKKAVLGVAAFENGVDLGNTVTYEVGKRQAKTISLKAYAEEVPGVSLKISFGVDPAMVDVYNQANGTSYEVLPGDAYKFGEQEVIMPRFNQYSAESKFTLVGQGCVEDQFYVLPVVITKVNGYDNYVFSETKKIVYFLMKVLPSNKGTGTKDDPFIIEELEDFKTMNEKLLPGDKVYFDLKTDLDLTPITEWTALNNAKPYDCNVIFNGNGHKLSNFSATTGIFHVLNGSVENLVIENANVTGGANTAVLANYIGYTDINSTVKNVTFKDSKFSGAAVSGMLAANTYNSVIEQVYFDNCDITLLNSARRQGYLTGYVNAKTEFINCYAKGGKCSGGSQQCGGLIGQVCKTEAIVTNCGISSEITGNRAMGGIIAYVQGPDGHTTVENCVVWTPSISAVVEGNQGKNQYSSGAVVGCSEQATVTYKNNYRRADFTFNDQDEAFGPVKDCTDIENATYPSTSSDSFFTHAFGYHGIAAAAGKTASQVAKDLGWDEAIWDLSGAEPKLK